MVEVSGIMTMVVRTTTTIITSGKVVEIGSHNRKVEESIMLVVNSNKANNNNNNNNHKPKVNKIKVRNSKLQVNRVKGNHRSPFKEVRHGQSEQAGRSQFLCQMMMKMRSTPTLRVVGCLPYGPSQRTPALVESIKSIMGVIIILEVQP